MFKRASHILLTTHNHRLDSYAYLQLLQTCIANNGLSPGKQIHSLIAHRGFAFATRLFLQNKLISMYVKCESLVDARKVLVDMKERDDFSWNTIIAAYQRHGCPYEALALFHQMQRTDFQPNQFTIASILPACAKIRALEQGRNIHQSIMERGFLSDVVVGSALVDMYAKCGSIHKARALFDKMPYRNVISWNAMIAGYAQHGLLDESLRLIKEMPRPDVISWNAMIAGYAQNGNLDKALKLFKQMPQRNVVSWNTMITAYAQHGFAQKALEAFKQMQLARLKPNYATFASILPTCAKMGALEHGMDIHQIIIESGFLSDVVTSALVNMYAKCGNIEKACELFDKMSHRDVVSWTAMIAGYVQNGFVEKAFETFKKMQLDGVKPDSTTFASILPGCAKMGALEQGMDIHQSIIKRGFLSNVIVANALIGMYAKCGSIHKARELFGKMSERDVVSWNVMIAGFAQSGVLDQASRLFKEMPQPDAISWNAIVAGYAQNGFVEKALEAFKQMQLAGLKPNSTTFASILPACAKMGALEQGMDIHQNIIESGFFSDVVVASALVDMYAKCGSIHKACELFVKMPQRNVITWNAMIAGYAQNGFCKDALKIFELMKHFGTYPDHVSFTCVLFACSHAGLVDEGSKYFNGMSDTYYIKPKIDHYVCMVDLLGRAGYLEETLNFIIKMPIKPVVVVWMCLLGACRSYKNIGLGIFTSTLLFELDPKNVAIYVLLSSIYAEAGRWGELQKETDDTQNTGDLCKVGKIVLGDEKAGYFPDSSHIWNDVEEEKELFLCHHGEKLAFAFGLLNTPSETFVDCHTTTNFISMIVVRDANQFHHLKQGQCSCGDYW